MNTRDFAAAGRIFRAAGLAAAMAGSAAFPGTLSAQPADPPAAAARPPAPQPGRLTPAREADLNEYVARAITRAALMDLRVAASPQPEDYRIAGILLGLAHDLLPKDTEIIRRQIEAAANAGDKQGVLDLTRTLLRLDPSDTVAQLRLIVATITGRTQDADERLAVYERYLSGPDARGFDPSVRSRLALDAALLLRDAGDMKGFAERLTLATQLDPTHKEAHALAATVYAEQRPDDTAGRLQMLEHLLMADPVDPNVHLSISRELCGRRAFAAARRFHRNAVVILQAAAVSTERAAIEEQVLRWHVEGPGVVAGDLNRELTAARNQARENLRRLEAAKQPTTRAPKPEDVRRSSAFETLYIAAVHATGDTAATEAAVQDLAAYGQTAPRLLEEQVRAGRVSPEQAKRIQQDMWVQLQSLRLWTGVQADQAKQELEANPGFREQAPEAAATLLGWAALRAGDALGAIEQLEPRATADMFAELGVGVAYEQLDQLDRALERYDRVVRLAPLEIAGAWARARMQKLGAAEDTSEVARLERVVADIPAHIGAGMVEDARRFVQLTVSVLSPAPEGIDRSPLRLTLENLSPYPLALGPDRALSSRFLMMPRTDSFVLGELRLAQPEVIDLDRRLRLMPGEKLQADVWPDAGPSGWLMETIANRSVRVRWRVVQGFVSDPQAGFRPGPMCVGAESDPVVRRPVAEARLSPDVLASKVAGDPVDSFIRLAAGTRSMLLQPLLLPEFGAAPAPEGAPRPAAPAPGEPPARAAVQPPPAEQVLPVGKAYADRYPTLSPTVRAMLAVVLPHARLAPGMTPLDQAVAADSDPAVLCLALALRVADPADPLLARAKESDDPRVKELAELVAARLGGADPIYARRTAESVMEARRKAIQGDGK